MSLLTDVLAALDRWEEWKRMRAAPARLDDLEKRIQALEAKPRTVPGRTCKACGENAARLTSSTPDKHFGPVGGNREIWTCTSCNHAEEILT